MDAKPAHKRQRIIIDRRNEPAAITQNQKRLLELRHVHRHQHHRLLALPPARHCGREHRPSRPRRSPACAHQIPERQSSASVLNMPRKRPHAERSTRPAAMERERQRKNLPQAPKTEHVRPEAEPSERRCWRERAGRERRSGRPARGLCVSDSQLQIECFG